MSTETQALERQKGKTVESIQHHELVGIVAIHFTDKSSIQLFAQEKASQQLTIFENTRREEALSSLMDLANSLPDNLSIFALQK